MDPKECINILTKAYADHQADCECCPVQDVPPPPQPPQGARPARRREFILEGAPAAEEGDDSADEVEVIASQEPARMNRVESQSQKPEPQFQGQVLNLASGENETLLSAEALLEEFPALKPGPTAEGLRPEGAAFQPPARRSRADLAAEVICVHGERVRVHKAYDGSFQMLLSGKGGGKQSLARLYPLVTQLATERFQSLSSRVRAAAEGLEEAAAGDDDGDAKEAANLARALQSCEKERLQLVAQLHIEQSRMALGARDPANDEPEPEPVAAARSNCAKLRQRLGATDARIEETVSELRYCMADLQDS